MLKNKRTFEREGLESCLKQIEAQLDWGPAEGWTTRQFEQLSTLLLEHSGVLLSATTLKRLWGRAQYNSSPQPATLDALAVMAGATNWAAWAECHQTDAPERRTKPRFFTGIVAFIALGMLGLVWLSVQRMPFVDPEMVTFYSQPVARGVPNTVVFHYDVTGTEARKVAIQQSWDERLTAEVPVDGNTFTTVYYYPGYYRAKLWINGRITGEHDVFVGSNQWLALINRYPDQPVYLPERSLNRANGLSVLWDQLKGSAIQQPTTNYNISYYYLRDMGPVSSDDFVFQTSIRNPVTGPNNPCRSIRVSLVCTQGRISVPLTIAGCSGDIRLVAGDHVIDGRNEDLSAFSADLDQWQPLSVSSKNGALVIALNNQIIYKLPDFKSVGRITGFHYSFEGDGAIRELQLSETSGRTVFSDCFDLY